MALHDHRWAFQPVDPSILYHLLEACLGLGDGSTRTPMEIVSGAMPEEDDPQFRDKYLLREVLRKYPGFDLGIDTRLAAITSFYEDEAVNTATNDRLASELPSATIAQVLQLARKKIAAILGPFSEAEFWDGWRFGPKSTLSLRRHQATVENKIALGTPTCTVGAYPLYLRLISGEPFWAFEQGRKGSDGTIIPVECRARIAQYDRYECVTKNAMTGRGIGIPADVNVAFQLSVGRMIRSRLFKSGINLNDQSINQQLAEKASLTGCDATVDMKSASQSVTCGIVYNLLGSQSTVELDWRWYWVLDALRAPYTLIDGDMHENELFSAMGNGYTFELESLVFYSLAWACTHFLGLDATSVSVYGDDIVLPVGSYTLFCEVCSFAGFRINKDKTYASTGEYRFRESCGKHYLNGASVTPFYIDSPLDSPATIVLAANNLLRWALKPGHRDGRVLPVWLYLVSHLGTGYLGRRIPLSEANDGLIADWDECCPSSVSIKSEPPCAMPTHIGWKAKTVVIEPRTRPLSDEPRYLRWQYHASGHSGFRPPPVPILGGRRFGVAVRRQSTVEPSLRTAPEPPRSIGVKASLQLGSRVVTSWPWLGPWVTDDLVVESTDVELLVRLKQAGVTLSVTPPMGPVEGNKGRKRSRKARPKD